MVVGGLVDKEAHVGLCLLTTFHSHSIRLFVVPSSSPYYLITSYIVLIIRSSSGWQLSLKKVAP